jgi:hypothetical protein
VRSLGRQEIEAATPSGGFFKDKEWRLSPEPFRISRDTFTQLIELGSLLTKFISTCEALYHDSKTGSSPRWLSELLDLGKPAHIVNLGCHPLTRGQYARVIRPDILLTSEGMILSEIDSTPGGIGLTGWLNQLYGGAGWKVIGTPTGMIEGFRDVLEGGRVIFSREALDYRPEIEWIVAQIAPLWKERHLIVNEWEFDSVRHSSSNFYRYFELWDMDNVEKARELIELLDSGSCSFTAPMKAYLEEKLWLALLWAPGLKREWAERLGDESFQKMKTLVPQSWVMDPTPIPYHSVYPGLNIQDWNQLTEFSQTERQLVLKISGFSEKAWGSRGVTIGHDISSTDWAKRVNEALTEYIKNPRILQRFHNPTLVEHPYYVNNTNQIETMQGRVRLCPYYFRSEDSVELKGVLATICPKEKKIIHGMRDAIMVPCVVGD